MFKVFIHTMNHGLPHYCGKKRRIVSIFRNWEKRFKETVEEPDGLTPLIFAYLISEIHLYYVSDWVGSSTFDIAF